MNHRTLSPNYGYAGISRGYRPRTPNNRWPNLLGLVLLFAVAMYAVTHL